MTESENLLIRCRYEKANVVASVASRGSATAGIKPGSGPLGGVDSGRVNLGGFTKERGQCYAN